MKPRKEDIPEQGNMQIGVCIAKDPVAQGTALHHHNSDEWARERGGLGAVPERPARRATGVSVHHRTYCSEEVLQSTKLQISSMFPPLLGKKHSICNLADVLYSYCFHLFFNGKHVLSKQNLMLIPNMPNKSKQHFKHTLQL